MGYYIHDTGNLQSDYNHKCGCFYGICQKNFRKFEQDRV